MARQSERGREQGREETTYGLRRNCGCSGGVTHNFEATGARGQANVNGRLNGPESEQPEPASVVGAALEDATR